LIISVNLVQMFRILVQILTIILYLNQEVSVSKIRIKYMWRIELGMFKED